jgi:hypothetical protein
MCKENSATQSVTTPASARSVGRTSISSPQSQHNFSDLAKLVKRKWYSKPLPQSQALPKPQLSLSVPTNFKPQVDSYESRRVPDLLEVKSLRSVLSPLAEPFSCSSSNVANPETSALGFTNSEATSSEITSPTVASSNNEIKPISLWHHSIQPYEMWSQATVATTKKMQETSDGDDDKTIPFPPYVEPHVPGFDFMTGTATDTDTDTGPNGPTSIRSHQPLGCVATPTIQITAAPISGMLHVFDGHADGFISERNSRCGSAKRREEAAKLESEKSSTPRGAVDEYQNKGIEINMLESDRDHPIKVEHAITTELEAMRKKVTNLTESIHQVTSERDGALQTARQASDRLADTQKSVVAQEEKILDMKQELVAEQMKVHGLEEEIEYRQRSFQQKFDRLQEKHVKKVGESEAQREEIIQQDKLLDEARKYVLRASNKGELLYGAAHLVVPDRNYIFQNEVVSCFECYTTGRTCDSRTRCRGCTETRSRCARWRCANQHVLGQCPAIPCPLPHDREGWLILHRRAEW